MSLYPSQIKKLKEMARREGKTASEVMREAVKGFLDRGLYERNTFNLDSSWARGTQRVYPRFSKVDWDRLNRISLKTNKFRAELVREAVDEYLVK